MEKLRTSVFEAEPAEEVLELLIRLSGDWEREDSCYGYRKNKRSDIDGNRIFLAKCGGKTVGYLFGHVERSSQSSSVMPEGTACFEVEELYVRPEFRSLGVGRSLFRFAESAARPDAEFMTVSTATKNWRAIMHFYIEEVGMEFWSARLFKRIAEK